jgi:class 3 adenylate cyclase
VGPRLPLTLRLELYRRIQRFASLRSNGEELALDFERRTVTALFADLKAAMDLIEDLDPEEARAIVNPALKLMIDAVHRCDGYIVQSTGDGIFAPLAHPSRTRTIRNGPYMLRCACRRHSGAMPTQVARARTAPVVGASWSQLRSSSGPVDPNR